MIEESENCEDNISANLEQSKLPDTISHTTIPSQSTIKNTTKEQKFALRNAKKRGHDAGMRGFPLATQEVLMLRNGYTQEQALVYIASYKEATDKIPPEELALRNALQRAKTEGSNTFYRGARLESEQAIMERKGYTQAQAQAFIDAYHLAESKGILQLTQNNNNAHTYIAEHKNVSDSMSLTELELYGALLKAKSAGKNAGYKGYNSTSQEELMNRNGYTQEQAQAYIDAYQKSKRYKALQTAQNKGNDEMNPNEDISTQASSEISDHGTELLSIEEEIEPIDQNTSAEREKALENAKKQGCNAALRGHLLTSNKVRMAENGDELARAYITGYKSIVDLLSPEGLLLRRTKAVWRDAGFRGTPPPSYQELKKINYTQEQAQAYIHAYLKVKKKSSEEQVIEAFFPQASSQNSYSKQVIHIIDDEIEPLEETINVNSKEEKVKLRRARKAGLDAGKNGYSLAFKEDLMKRNGYTQEQALAYIAAYNESSNGISPAELELRKALRNAKAAGGDAGYRGKPFASEQQLREMKGYTREQALAYIDAYHKAYPTRILQVGQKNKYEVQAKKDISPQESPQISDVSFGEIEPLDKEHEKALENIKESGRIAASEGFALSSKEALMAKYHYTQDQALAYIAAYEEMSDSIHPDVLALQKAKTSGVEASYRGHRLESERNLMAWNGYTQAQAQVYIEAYTKSQAAMASINDYIEESEDPIDEEIEPLEKAELMLAKKRGYVAGISGYSLAPEETLMKRNGYTQKQALAYIAAYKTISTTSAISLQGGIAEKYIDKPLPKLPAPPRTGEFITYEYNNQIQLIPLLKVTSSKAIRKPIKIKTDEIQATLHTAFGELNSSDQAIFVFAGRKEAALVPTVAFPTRCILVLTQAEYDVLNQDEKIDSTMDILILERISSSTHGDFTQLGLLTARRIGVFLTAEYFGLNHCMVMDDNLTKIDYKAPSVTNSINSFYEALQQKLGNKGCISIATHSLVRKTREKELGSKLFLFNMNVIRQHLPELKDLFLLLPSASQANIPLEDYYTQTVLESILQPFAKGYEVQSRELAVLHRSPKNRNACAKLGMRAGVFTPPENFKNLTLQQAVWLEEALNALNKFIDQRIESYKEKAKKLSEANLGQVHAVAHSIFTAESASSSHSSHSHQERQIDFVSHYKSILKNFEDKKNILRHYQVAAINTIAHHNTFNCSFLNATGCGKSMILYQLAANAYAALNTGEYVVVITPQKELTHQLYEDFIDYYEKFEEARFSMNRIITISSHPQSCSIKLLERNHSLSNQKTILIFCLESFIEFYKIQAFKEGIRLALFDEFHDYPKNIRSFVEQQPKDSLLIGCSATLPVDNALSAPIYTYNFTQAITEGFLAPIIVDGLGTNYSREKVDELINCLPTLLQSQFHPGFEDTSTLSTTKDIVYLPNIKDCEKAANILRNANIPCYIVNSKNPDYRNELKTFLASKSGVVFAVHMLRFGFNDVDLGAVIIAQNLTNSNDPNHLNLLMQMIGRPLRKKGDKMAYVITFDDTKALIDKFIKDVPHTLSASIDYLSQNNSYYLDDRLQRWLVVESEDLPKNIQASFVVRTSDDYAKRRYQFDDRDSLQVFSDKIKDSVKKDEVFVRKYVNQSNCFTVGMKRKVEIKKDYFNQRKFGR